MNIVITTSPAVEDRHGVRSLPPLSIGYIAAGARGVPGARVTIVDAYGEGLDSEQALARVLALEPDVLAVSATSMCYPSGLRLVREVKRARPATATVMGGYHPTMFDRLMLAETPELDFVLRGEADLSFPALCRALQDGAPLAQVAGLSYRENGGIVRGVPQQVEDLDALPFPDREALDYPGYYHQFGGFFLPVLPRMANIVSSRSCPYHCTFCPKMFPEWRYRTRSAGNLFREIRELYDRGYRAGFFQDENFSHDLERLEQLCRMILDSGIRMRFVFQGTIHHIPQDIFDLMHRAGFDCLFVGIESGSDDQLRRYRKPGTSAMLAGAVARAKKAHMIVIGFFIHGGAGETPEDCLKTQDFLRNARPHVAGASTLGLQPGSILWDELLGPGEPESLDKTRLQPIFNFPHVQTKESVRQQTAGFERAFADSWRTPARILDIADLLLRNGLVQRVMLRMACHPRQLLRLVRHMLNADKIRGIDFEKSKYAHRRSR